MLGKRFHRTTSMSQLGPGSDHEPPEKADKKLALELQGYSILCSTGVSQKEAYPQDAADCTHGGVDVHMVHDFDPSHMLSTDIIFTESPPCQAHEELSIDIYGKSSAIALQAQTPSPLVPYQMGLWTHHHTGFGSYGKLQHMSAEASMISPVDFLDVCFYCKRRLRHEKDIFIYRGDSAFCSEECRHRQILSDERPSRKGANKKQGGPRTSETAVAA